MHVPFIDDVKIFPEKAFPVKKTLHELRNDVILQIDDFEQKLYDVFLLDFFPFGG